MLSSRACLEGQGVLISILISRRRHVKSLLSPILTYFLLSPPDPPSRAKVYANVKCLVGDASAWSHRLCMTTRFKVRAWTKMTAASRGFRMEKKFEAVVRGLGLRMERKREAAFYGVGLRKWIMEDNPSCHTWI